jgi:hypothetical protein
MENVEKCNKNKELKKLQTKMKKKITEEKNHISTKQLII